MEREHALKMNSGRVVGARQTLRRIAMGQVQAVYVAQDAQDALIEPVLHECTNKGIPVIFVETMAELGQMCGIAVGAACAAQLRS
ncbi:MAG: ribosomal L7Ae/L30e/S12e/Gadd45 family protein [Firmicutes bacterium]|nr:ribosomal L7Ae/L30e/S12e/Gadd45 family protein [Bacillota bacterium]